MEGALGTPGWAAELLWMLWRRKDCVSLLGIILDENVGN
jgi:hypothetical protein